MESLNKKEKTNQKAIIYETAKFCPACGEKMQYIYGERFECRKCGCIELSDFGKVKEFLDLMGPQPGIIISEKTGVKMEYINELLRQGRIEIPDGSDIYIQCQKCGTDIRYGRYCPECMMRLAKDVGHALWMPEVGEKPTNKRAKSGKMHILGKT